MKDEKENSTTKPKNIRNKKKSKKNKEEDTNKLIEKNNIINNIKESSNKSINYKILNDFHGIADEFQKKEINKIIRSKYSSKLLSFTEGLSEFSHLAISYYFKDNLKLSPSKSSFFRSLISFPFIFQPFFGLISDLFPIFGYKRKAYLIIGGGLNCFFWILLSYINSNQILAILILLIISLNDTFINACSGGILVEVSKKLTLNHKKLERYNASSIYKNIGMIISSIFRGIIIDLFGVKIIFIMAGGLSLFNTIAGLIYFELKLENKEEHNYQIIKNDNENNENFNTININHIHHSNNSEEGMNNINNKIGFLEMLNNKNILIPLFLVLFFSSCPSYFESAFYYLTDIKHFNPRNFGQLTIFMMLMMLSTSIIYKRYLKDMNKKSVILWSSLISFFSSSFFNIYLIFNLKSKIIVFLSISLYVSIKAICSKPMLDLAFLACPKGYEGSVMGLFGSALSFGKTISTFSGSLLTMLFKVEKSDYSNFNLMIFVNNIISLFSIFGLFLIDDELLSLRANKKLFNFKKKQNKDFEIEVDIFNEKTSLKEINNI